MLTPEEVHNKEFNKKLRGYDVDEVHVFLNELAHDFEQLYREKEELEAQVNYSNSRIEQYENIEGSLNKSLVLAQETANHLKESSQKEADLILEEAQISADNIVKEALDEAAQVRESTENLRDQTVVFRQRLQLMLESQIELVKNEEWDRLLDSFSIPDSEPNYYTVSPAEDEFILDADEDLFSPIYAEGQRPAVDLSAGQESEVQEMEDEETVVEESVVEEIEDEETED